MTTSQFTIFSSDDANAPVISGSATGSLINVLNYCLVSGSGWIKPFGDTGSVGVFQMPTGSGMTLAVIDNALGAAGNKEARIQGWETCVSVLNGIPSGSAITTGSGCGIGCFPSGSQSSLFFTRGGGYLIARKTNNVDTAIRPWYVFADSSSMYCFIATGDSSGSYYGFSFGDIFSFKSGSDDRYRCLLIGRAAENSSAANQEQLDALTQGMTTANNGHFAAKSYTGNGYSLAVAKGGDLMRGVANTLGGVVQYPNGTDNSLYLSPIYVQEITNRTVRGKMRGFWQVCHAASNFSDGQSFSGSNDMEGRTFTFLKTAGGGGAYMLETSNTIETN